MRIVVTGLSITYPLGGVFWDYMQYVLGFARMGHDVLYLEDFDKWCYDPGGETFVESGARNVTWFARQVHRLDPSLSDRWTFRDTTGQRWGWEWPRVVEFCRSADLFLHISGSCHMRDEYYSAQQVAFIDSDPMYTQAMFPDYQAGRLTADSPSFQSVAMIERHRHHFTFAENIAGHDCLVPRTLVNWRPTRQPVVLPCFRGDHIDVALPARRNILTTVMSWEAAEKGPAVAGVQYFGKSREFLDFIDLPGRSAIPLEIALSGKAPYDQLRLHGWKLIPALQVSSDPWVYRGYLANSFGEWSVAKHAYVKSRSGWFSCRSACYLALGVPVIVQDTGFGCAIPTGEGVLSFATLDDACAAIESVASNPARHAQAAREIAQNFFDAEIILTRLLEDIFSVTRS